MRVKNTYTCTIHTNDDQNIVMTDNNSLYPLLSKLPDRIAYQT